MSFPILYERAGEVAVGDYIGGKYQFDFDVQLNGATLTAMAPQTQTVLDLVINGQLTGTQVVVPSGLPGTEVTVVTPFSPAVVVKTSILSALTPSVRWQCISGAPSVTEAISQVDLLLSGPAAGRFSPGRDPVRRRLAHLAGVERRKRRGGGAGALCGVAGGLF